MEDIVYKSKYLKYKEKYHKLKVKLQLGGFDENETSKVNLGIKDQTNVNDSDDIANLPNWYDTKSKFNLTDECNDYVIDNSENVISLKSSGKPNIIIYNFDKPVEMNNNDEIEILRTSTNAPLLNCLKGTKHEFIKYDDKTYLIEIENNEKLEKGSYKIKKKDTEFTFSSGGMIGGTTFKGKIPNQIKKTIVFDSDNKAKITLFNNDENPVLYYYGELSIDDKDIENLYKPNGEGKLVTSDKINNINSGQWSLGKSDNVTIDIEKSNIYQGDTTGDGIKNGKGIFVDLFTGDSYDGEWTDNNKKGKGNMIFKSHDKYDSYDGDWDNDKMHGKGKIIFNETSEYKEYEGDIETDIINGKGKVTYKEGESYDGEWESGKKKWRWYK